MPLLAEIALACVLGVLGSSVLMRFLDPRSTWALRTHILTGVAITACLVVVLGGYLSLLPFARRQ